MKKRISALLAVLTLAMLLYIPTASAEGFVYNFKPIEETGLNSVGPHCKSILMENLDTETVAYAYNPDDRLPMASITKIMSYIVAYENIPDIERVEITVPQNIVDALAETESSLAHLEAGEVFTGLQLLNLMMVPSGNDAALLLATYTDSLGITLADVRENLPEGENPDRVLSFVDLMNLKAQELGCENTRFMNAHGLHDENHYSTARDIMIFTKYALSLPYFAEITSQRTYTLEPINENTKPREEVSTNKMLLNEPENYMYATGIKTGSHDQAGFCIAASALYEGYTYIVVALGCPSYDPETGEAYTIHGEMYDAAELFRWAFTELAMKTVVDMGQVMGSIELQYAWKKDTLQVAASADVNCILPKSVENTSIISELDLPEKVQAPIKKGDVIGTAKLTYADGVVGYVDLVAAETVERSDIMMTLEQGKQVFTSKWFLLIIGLIGVLILVYIVLIIIYRQKRKRLKNSKRFRDM